ncbi:molybdenum cofactor sulfurase 1 [Culex quinquefasciatus]|uniref:molybdenum cofactor sulfurase 1 n=1 Tax=Culex quinquefasciatus TaxID=7176 RepID=UPI0018E3AD2F|nr:molybdenum cofactor sulfurase 1 [Culex quinquefasciatus]
MEFVQEYSDEEAAAIEREFTRLKDKHYLDHAGATLYAESQIRAVHDLLTANMFGNPHTSHQTGQLMDEVRRRVLRFFNTDSSEYSLIFTSGATASLKMVAENFTFRAADSAEGDEGAFVYLRDNHTSVLGMRAIVGTSRIHPLERENFVRHLKVSARSSQRKPSLVVFPAQNNFNAAKYPLELIEEIRENGLVGYDDDKFYVCLDVASFVSTNFLDLDRYKPDFVCMSFYKIFGYPTGLGALLIRKGSEDLLDKKYYGGGTIQIVMSGKNLHRKHVKPSDRFEDGTQPFLSIIALLEGFNTIQRLIPPSNGYRSMERVSKHVFNLAKYCYHQLGELVHANGAKVIHFYMDSRFESRDRQGGIVTFNVLKDDGSYVGYAEFARIALKHDVYLRAGCFCNSGTCQRQLKLSDEGLLEYFKMGKICGDDNDMIDGHPTGTVRAAFGYMTKPENVDRLVEMIRERFVSQGICRPVKPTNRSSNDEELELKAIYIYPIRSCGSFTVTTSWPMVDRGLKHDREFSIVNSNGTPLSQSKHTDMASIVPKIDPRSNVLILTHPTMPDLILNLNKLPTAKSTILPGDSVDCGDEIAAWISKALRQPRLRLVKHLNDGNHSPPPKILMINGNALRSLGDEDSAEDQATASWLVEHFQGNLVVEAPATVDMQTWKQVAIGEHRFKVVGMCTRCPMIYVDPASGKVSADSLKAIANVFKKKVPLGMYLAYVGDGGATARSLQCGGRFIPEQKDHSKVTSITESVVRFNFNG